MKVLFLLPLLAVAVAGGAVDLTEDNFDAEVFDSGKAAFIKFLAPWCGHCKKMKPAWDQLGDAFASSKTVIIGDVDCTIHKNVCSRFGVRGYPTIKYFTGDTAADGDKYEGGRDFNSLKQFADENLGPSCSNDNKDLCNEDQLALLEEANALSAEDLQAAIDSKAQELAQAETDFKAEVEGLNQRYQELMKEKDAKIAAVSPSLKMYRAAARSASEAAADKDEL